MDPVIFDWAKELASKLPEIEVINIRPNCSLYVQELDRHISMYHNDGTSETFLVTVCGESRLKTVYVQRVNNFDEVKKVAPWLVDLWLRNGEYLYTRLTTGTSLKVVNMNYVRTLKPRPPQSPQRG